LTSLSRLRVCFVGHGATLEGAGRYLLDQARYLTDKGVTVFSILPRHGPLAERLSQSGVAVRYAPNHWWAVPVKVTSEVLAHTGRAAALMATFIRDWKVDVLYSHTVVAPAGAIAAALAGRPHIWHIHEFAFNPGAIEMSVPKATLAALIDQTSNAVLFNSQAVEREWAGAFSAAKTRVVYNWVRPTSAPAALPPEFAAFVNDDAYVITIVGSIQRWKRQLDAVRAIDILRRRNLPVRLFVIGPVVEPDYQAEIERFVLEHDLGDYVRLVGYLDDPGRVVARAHASVLCSVREPFGRVTIDSMAMGVPVVATNSGGTPEIIANGDNGLLFETGDVEGLANHLEHLWRDRGLRDRLAVAAKRRAAIFSNADTAMLPVVEVMEKVTREQNPAWSLGEALRPAILPLPEGPDNVIGWRNRLGRVTSAIRRLRLAGGFHIV
jgi:glycosyltransferase involved in cell wall biosynthesis